MLLAIDVGNTDLKCGIWHGGMWSAIWRRPTLDISNSGELLEWLYLQAERADLKGSIERVGCASVVPDMNDTVQELAAHLGENEPFFVSAQTASGLAVHYDPVTAVGADRVANILGALSQYKPPVISVDFGSATTLDVASEDGFLGGAILPGLELQRDILASRAAQLPQVPLALPPNSIGNSTAYGIQSGIVFGHLAAVEGLLARMERELGRKATVVATGGLYHLFVGATESIQHFVPTLTLDGIRVAVAQSYI